MTDSSDTRDPMGSVDLTYKQSPVFFDTRWGYYNYYKDLFSYRDALGVNRASKDTGFHARGFLPYLAEMGVGSVCDIGTGDGRFCLWARDQGIDPIIGVDWVCPAEGEGVTWITAPAWEVPIDDNSVEWITAFDMMEHIFEEDIDETLDEFARIASVGFIFQIAYKQSGGTHLTVQPKEWWINRISRVASLDREVGEYLIFRLL